MCSSRKTVHAMDNSSESDSSETETIGSHFIGSVHSSNTKDEAFATLLLGKQNCEVKFKLDTALKIINLSKWCLKQQVSKLANLNAIFLLDDSQMLITYYSD